MKKQTDGQSNSFRAPLLELVIIIGIFAIVSVYLLRMFMVADKFQGKAVATTKALVRAESVAEYIRACDATDLNDFLNKLKAEFGFSVNSSDGDPAELIINYDKSWKPVENKAAYVMLIAFESEKDSRTEGIKLTGHIKVYSKDMENDYCDLEFSKFIQ